MPHEAVKRLWRILLHPHPGLSPSCSFYYLYFSLLCCHFSSFLINHNDYLVAVWLTRPRMLCTAVVLLCIPESFESHTSRYGFDLRRRRRRRRIKTPRRCRLMCRRFLCIFFGLYFLFFLGCLLKCLHLTSTGEKVAPCRPCGISPMMLCTHPRFHDPTTNNRGFVSYGGKQSERLMICARCAVLLSFFFCLFLSFWFLTANACSQINYLESTVSFHALTKCSLRSYFLSKNDSHQEFLLRWAHLVFKSVLAGE